ncbi:DNA-directed RNA polymerase subunit omega [Seleniivibrio woodruffii]|uniref:DNA-directed RNA polymerase subunit omega n=1 Tax=Seleniivibrio woodruffii TaxID=1078050 RepID=A0A4R1KAB4_9BACT|nr:DNA-directed RNA polymerase subunit omega [Seleniivibrio woodruffii]TCK60980.1 DNA-directed RNA polymerase subunit omega [Seleniivibrio woodruffii]TVZ36610.1 DNA-directed RNA polymerase subunit omega [Seleniivibrio woodruffii]
MPLLDIEQIISKPTLRSRFKLVHVAGLRARELNTPKEDTLSRKSDEYSKNTTNALNELITGKIDFDEQDV